MSDLTIGLLGALLATNQPLAVSNLVQQQTGVSIAVANPSDPAEMELEQLMEDDDAALAEVDQWIQTNNALVARGGGETREALNQRIRARLNTVRNNYASFLRRHPDSARGYLAYGSFLDDIGDEESARVQFENAAQIDPKNPAAWNNLANYYGDNGPLTNAFADYARAIDLDPTEPVYYENLATTVYLFRKDAREYYGLNEQQVFDKALALYRKAIQLDPDNFALATDYAESYYGIRPLRTNDALMAWTNALNTAHNDVEREGVFIHLARVKIAAGRFGEARAQLDAVTNAFYASLKDRLERSLVEHENAATNTSAGERFSTNGSNSSTRRLSAPTNAVVVATNIMAVQTNPPPQIVTRVPVLTNPPPFSARIAATMTNVPPLPPRAANLQTPSTNVVREVSTDASVSGK